LFQINLSIPEIDFIRRRRKTIVDLLDEDAIASVSYVEPGKEQRLLEKKLMNR